MKIPRSIVMHLIDSLPIERGVSYMIDQNGQFNQLLIYRALNLLLNLLHIRTIIKFR